ncbi:MAG: ribonuclease R, partial [Lysinibacillus sp.]
VTTFARTRKATPKVIHARKNYSDSKDKRGSGRSSVGGSGSGRRRRDDERKGQSQGQADRKERPAASGERRESERDPRGRRKDGSSPGPKKGVKEKQKFYESVAKKGKKKKPKRK